MRSRERRKKRKRKICSDPNKTRNENIRTETIYNDEKKKENEIENNKQQGKE